MFNPFNAPKVINLDTYGEGSENITGVLLSLFAKGGGTQTINSDYGLFSDANTKRPLKIKFTSLNDVVVTTQNVNTTHQYEFDDMAIQVNFECLVNMGATNYRVTVFMTLSDIANGKVSNMKITLKIGTV